MYVVVVEEMAWRETKEELNDDSAERLSASLSRRRRRHSSARSLLGRLQLRERELWVLDSPRAMVTRRFRVANAGAWS